MVQGIHGDENQVPLLWSCLILGFSDTIRTFYVLLDSYFFVEILPFYRFYRNLEHMFNPCFLELGRGLLCQGFLGCKNDRGVSFPMGMRSTRLPCFFAADMLI